jgi:hypothetical protein
MNTIDPLLGIAIGALTVLGAALAGAALRRSLRARAQRTRVVEKPNSHYTSQVVRDGEARHRWQNIAIERIHEVNRGEVKRLLAKIEALGVDALQPTERKFLDNVGDVRPPAPAPEPRDSGRRVAPDLRHRPA